MEKGHYMRGGYNPRDAALATQGPTLDKLLSQQGRTAHKEPRQEGSPKTLPTDVCCHPSRDVLAVATVDGDVLVHSYGSERRTLLHPVHHQSSCRKVRFSADGSQLLTAAKDLCLVDLATGALVQRLPHSAPIYSLCVVDNHLVATGDDDGRLKQEAERMALIECEPRLVQTAQPAAPLFGLHPLRILQDPGWTTIKAQQTCVVTESWRGQETGNLVASRKGLPPAVPCGGNHETLGVKPGFECSYFFTGRFRDYLATGKACVRFWTPSGGPAAANCHSFLEPYEHLGGHCFMR
ncbi:hypothetical protein HPB48_003479 [Haemaphysalis longicornis]|uniref:WD repeat-containing protein 55 homolog n=1 Tax=Haemaphysalis longicornis TaxID=44386 RepID=A0A9J6GFH3_HAELO|nr:hypothetical protein HPB48_003479 [Haemaphysalis longicornis]